MNNRMNYNSIQFLFAMFSGTTLIEELFDSIGTRVSEVSHGILTLNPILTIALCFCNAHVIIII
jgi:hypothetical protein